MADKTLIEQCVMYCAVKGLEPIPIGTRTEWDGEAMLQAVHDFKGEFRDLNDRQRRLIASTPA